MYLYGRKEGKIGLFDKVALDTSDYPKGHRAGETLLLQCRKTAL
jgi:hypothetical protein